MRDLWRWLISAEFCDIDVAGDGIDMHLSWEAALVLVILVGVIVDLLVSTGA